MLKSIFPFLLLFIPFRSHAQKVYSVPYESQADVKVYVVKYESQADLKVFKVPHESQAKDGAGHWFFTKYPGQADKKIFFVSYEGQADLKIFFVPYPSKTGWRKREKQGVMEN
jgi:hypothetical protein